MTTPPGPAQHATTADALLRELDGTTFIVIDFEALTPTGRSPVPVEVAAITLACRDGELAETARFTELMKPPADVPVTGEFTRITAITATNASTNTTIAAIRSCCIPVDSIPRLFASAATCGDDSSCAFGTCVPV